MKTVAIICPFAQFGSPGAAQGAELLADALRELLDDVQKEKRPTRSRAFRAQVEIKELCFDTPGSLASWRQTARKAAKSALDHGQFLFWIGGNHLSVLPVYEECAARKINVVQFDAHLDLYNLDDCKTELNHGNFLRFAEKLPPIVNVGHRDLFLNREEIDRVYDQTYSAEEVARDAEFISRRMVYFAPRDRSIFIDLDCDVFDPAYFPATSHPLPFGLEPRLLLPYMSTLFRLREVRGVSISEFDPGRDRDDRSLQTLVWLIEWILLLRYER